MNFTNSLYIECLRFCISWKYTSKFVNCIWENRKNLFSENHTEPLKILCPCLQTKYCQRVEIRGGISNSNHPVGSLKWTMLLQFNISTIWILIQECTVSLIWHRYVFLLVFNVCMLIFIVIGQVAMTLTDDGHKIKPCKIICHLRLHTQSLATSWHILKNIPYKRKIEIESPWFCKLLAIYIYKTVILFHYHFKNTING